MCLIVGQRATAVYTSLKCCLPKREAPNSELVHSVGQNSGDPVLTLWLSRGSFLRLGPLLPLRCYYCSQTKDDDGQSNDKAEVGN